MHHLLTHTTGLPGAGDIFQWDPEFAHLAAYAPGEHFHYNNAMFDVLGILAWTLDGRELPELLRARILRPLGMAASEPVITMEHRERYVKNYVPFQSDRPFPRDGRLAEAPFVFATGGAGCIASTAADVGRYVRRPRARWSRWPGAASGTATPRMPVRSASITRRSGTPSSAITATKAPG